MQTILIIDDDAAIGNLEQEVLERAGYQVLRAYSGTEALLLLSGAADYLTKPFDTKELLARVAVRLREATRSPLAAVYTCGSLTLDTASHEVRAADTPVLLTRTEYAILKLLMQNPGQVLAKSVLLDRIGADTPDCTENSLKTHISNLRGKLRDAAGEDHIEAVWGIGFRLRTKS